MLYVRKVIRLDVLKIALIGITGIMLAMPFKNKQQEYTMIIGLATSLILLFYIAARLNIIVEGIHTLQKYLNIDSAYITTILKMIGITYIAEFASSLCKDAGYSSIAGQIEIFGKLVILSLSIPILVALLQTINGFLS